MRYYAVVGSNSITVDCSSSPFCPEGYVEMQGDRPSVEHIAQEDGSWLLPETTSEEIQGAVQKQLTDVVQAYMDDKVLERGYAGILAACTYATSSNGKFAAEGQACVLWRDEVWASCYAILAEVLAGERGIPTEEELLAELPELVWP